MWVDQPADVASVTAEFLSWTASRIQIEGFGDHSIDAKAARDEVRSGDLHSRAPILGLQDLQNASRHDGGLRLLDQISGYALLDGLARAACLGGDNRNTESAGLENNIRRALGPRGQKKDVEQ